jgi:hypothetical protein
MGLQLPDDGKPFVDVYIDTKNIDRNSYFLDQLREQASDIEADLGTRLDWPERRQPVESQGEPRRKTCPARIALELAGDWKDGDAGWQGLQKEMIVAWSKFWRFVRPRILAIPSP